MTCLDSFLCFLQLLDINIMIDRFAAPLPVVLPTCLLAFYHWLHILWFCRFCLHKLPPHCDNQNFCSLIIFLQPDLDPSDNELPQLPHQSVRTCLIFRVYANEL